MRTAIARSFRASLVAIVLGLAGLGCARTAPETPKAPVDGHEWNAMYVEKVDALNLVADVENGKAAYEEECAGCHQPNGAGRFDGKIPQLAGQHETVLIKQLADIRAGRRDNPVMHPYSMKLIDAQELADVSAYLQALPIPPGNGKGPGTEPATGAKRYRRDCASCHGEHGEGSDEKLHPVLAGQHYGYLLRQLREIASGERRNANPDMVKVVERYSDEEAQAVADYLSRLPWPGRPLERP